MNRFNRTKPQNHIRNLEQRTKRNVNRAVNKNITNYFKEERAQNNRKVNSFNRPRHHHKHHHHNHRNQNRNRNQKATSSNRNSNRNQRVTSSNCDNTVHLQFLPLYIYIFFAVTSILAQFTNERLSKIMAREWKEHKLAVILLYLFKLLWAVIIYLLCSNQYTKTAWFLVLLPVIIVLLVLLLAFAYVGTKLL